MKKRTIALVMAAVMLLGVAIGGTIAWLTAKTEKVVNTFTVGDINITLTESQNDDNADNNPNTNNYKIIPGVNIFKDPTVKVVPKSEAHWLFVEVGENNWPEFTEAGSEDRKIDYEIDNGWKLLDDKTNVYYREVAYSEEAQSFAVLKDNTVTVSENLTKTEINEIKEYPVLTIKAYAVQKANVASATAAWAILNP